MKLIKNIYKQKYTSILSCLLLFISLSNCVEPFKISTEGFESYLVVNTTITNELKNQQVILSRTFALEADGPNPEKGALVSVSTNTGTEYNFTETTADGIYSSNEQFQVMPNVEYQLKITTNNGRLYESSVVTSPQEATIGNVYAKRMTNDIGEVGVGIFIDAMSNSDEPAYLRYEYEETYKIVVPEWRRLDIVNLIIDPNTLIGDFTYAQRPIGEETCYNTRISNEIITTNTNSLSENKISNFTVKFIDATNISLAERYTIVVSQYVQSREANKFYEILRSFSASESLFSQTQTGFIEGNITSLSNENEKVIGFFDISTVSSQRLFFNRNDFLANDDSYEYACREYTPKLGEGESIEQFIARIEQEVKLDDLKFIREIGEKTPGNGYVTLINSSCGDCTVFGQSEKPDFWED